MPIRGIGFDYLGVTATLTGRSIFDVLGEITDLPATDIKAAYHHHNHLLQLGQIDEIELWRRVAIELDCQAALPKIQAVAVQNLPSPDPAILALSDRLRASGYRTGLLTNLSSQWKQALLAAGVNSHFDVTITSSDINAAKPNPEAFIHLAQRLRVATNELVFIDDRTSSLAGVEQLGIAPILYHDYDQLLVELKHLDVAWK